MKTHKSALQIVLLPLLLSVSSAALAIDWQGDDINEPTDWFVPENWNQGMVPDPGERVDIDAGTSNPAVVDGRSTPVLGNLYVGEDATGVLTNRNGGVVTNDEGYIGHLFVGNTNTLSVGTVTVTGAGSTWNNSGTLYVGYEGIGTLNIEDGGLVTSNIGIIGHEQTPGVEISDVETSVVTVRGPGSRWSMKESLNVGRKLNGTLNILEGGVVESNESPDEENTIGDSVLGIVNVLGAGSTWTIKGDLSVGRNGKSRLTIADDGLVDVGDGTVYLARDGFIQVGEEFVPQNAVGTLNMGAASGEDAMVPGKLNAAIVGFGNGPSTLVFNHTDESGTYAFAPNLVSYPSVEDDPHLILHEAGYTNFYGDGSLFDGTTTIHNSTLAINKSLGGIIDVNDGGILRGTGTLGGTTNINEGGTVAPGNSIGTLPVNNINFGAGSIYNVDLDGTLNVDLIHVTGTATLAGGTVTVSGAPSFFTYPYVILTSQNNTLTDKFIDVTDTVFFDYTLSYDSNNVYLTGQPTNSFCDVASTANQKSLGCDGLQSLPLTDELLRTLFVLMSVEEAREAYDALLGEFHPSLKGALMENSQRRVNVIKNRLQAAFNQSEPETSTAALGYFAAPTAFTSPALSIDGDSGAWITGYGTWSTIDATTNTVQTDIDLGGVVFGLDREAFDTMRIGLMGGYSQTDVAQDARASTGVAETLSVGLYGGTELRGATVSFGGIYNWHNIDTDRTVSYIGVSQDLTASYKAESRQLFGEVGYKIQATHSTTMIEPFAAISHISIDTDGFSETGGTAALTASADTQSTTFTTLGARAAMDVSNAVRATGTVGWRYAFGDIDPTSTFTISSSNPFVIAGAPIAQTAFVSELGVEADLPIGGIVSASYVGQIGGGTSAHGVDVSFKQRF